MFPLHDNIPSRVTPVVNYAIIGVCGAAFLAQLALESPERAPLIEGLGMIPARVLAPDKPVYLPEEVETPRGVAMRQRLAAPSPVPPWLTLATCVFLHGGFMHFAGNMWFLYVFGDNVEDRLGHVGYAVFYLACGVAASLTHLLTNLGSPIPTIGASGAIAGVMGAYMLLYPNAKVVSLVPLFVVLQVMVLPAPWFLGVWFALQLAQGLLASAHPQSTGVAWWAHIGGFVVGFVTALALNIVGAARAPVRERQSQSDDALFFPYRQYRGRRR